MAFNLYAQELHNPWETALLNPAAQVLALFEDNPFASFAEMDLSYSLHYEPYNHNQALAELKTNPEAGLMTRTMLPFYLEGGIARNPLQNGFRIGGDPRHLKQTGVSDRLTEYLNGWRLVLPAFCWGGVSADDRESVFFFDQLQVEPLPDCFGSFLGWYHVISPRGLEPYFTAEDLRALPAHKVDELADGTLTIMSYPDPLEFASQETTNRIVEITNYLNERRKD